MPTKTAATTVSKPNYSQALLPVTDGAEVSITAATYCRAIYLAENPGATGWPRAFLVRLSMGGSSQHQQAAGTTYRIPGPFAPGEVAGTVEPVSNGGDSSTFNVAKLTS